MLLYFTLPAILTDKHSGGEMIWEGMLRRNLLRLPKYSTGQWNNDLGAGTSLGFG